MSRRLLILPVLLGALALPAAPALAGDDNGDSTSDPTPTTTPAPDSTPTSSPNSATLHASQGCVSGKRAKATVTGGNIDSVKFYVDGKRVKTVSQPNSKGDYSFSMSCSHLRVGAHRARAVVSFSAGTPASKTLRFQITRSAQASPHFTG